MKAQAWVALLLVAASFAGCVGSDSVNDMSTSIHKGTDCNAAKGDIQASVEAHDADPFGERSGEANLTDCSSAGAFSLAAFGLSGTDIVSLGFEMTNETTCDGWIGTAASGPSPHYEVSVWEYPDGSTSLGYGAGDSGLPARASAGPVSTRQVAGSSNGSTASGFSLENATLDKGPHRVTFANHAWGGWETGLTDGAALLFQLSCKESFRFLGLESTDALTMFHSETSESSAAASVFAVGEANGGRILDETIEEPRRLAVGGIVFTGVGVLRVQDANGTVEQVEPVEEDLGVFRNVPAGQVTVDFASAGDVAVAVGTLYGPLSPVEAGPIVSNSSG